MTPSPAIVFFSTASGAGYGLLALLGLGHVTEDWGFGLVGLLLCLMLINMGIGRTTTTVVLTQQGVTRLESRRLPLRQRFAPFVTFVAMTALGVHWIFVDAPVPDWLGWITTACAVITSCLLALAQFGERQLSPGRRLMVLVDHVLFAWLSGSLFYLMFAGFFRGDVAWAQHNALIAIVATWGVTLALWRLMDLGKAQRDSGDHRDPTTGYAEVQAPGQDQGAGPGAIGAEFLLRYGERLRGLAVTCSGVIPLVLCALALWIDADTLTGLLAGLAALVTYPGVLLRRWLLFGEVSDKPTTVYDRQD